MLWLLIGSFKKREGYDFIMIQRNLRSTRTNKNHWSFSIKASRRNAEIWFEVPLYQCEIIRSLVLVKNQFCTWKVFSYSLFQLYFYFLVYYIIYHFHFTKEIDFFAAIIKVPNLKNSRSWCQIQAMEDYALSSANLVLKPGYHHSDILRFAFGDTTTLEFPRVKFRQRALKNSHLHSSIVTSSGRFVS